MVKMDESIPLTAFFSISETLRAGLIASLFSSICSLYVSKIPFRISYGPIFILFHGRYIAKHWARLPPSLSFSIFIAVGPSFSP